VVPWLRCKKLEVPVNIVQEKIGHVTAEPLFDDNAQHRQIFAILWKRVRWNQPTAITEPL